VRGAPFPYTTRFRSTVDGQEGVKEAIGMTGHRLEVETHIVTGSQTAVQNVIKCVHQAGFDVEDVVSQGLASGDGVLSANEVDLRSEEHTSELQSPDQ